MLSICRVPLTVISITSSSAIAARRDRAISGKFRALATTNSHPCSPTLSSRRLLVNANQRQHLRLGLDTFKGTTKDSIAPQYCIGAIRLPPLLSVLNRYARWPHSIAMALNRKYSALPDLVSWQHLVHP